MRDVLIVPPKHSWLVTGASSPPPPRFRHFGALFRFFESRYTRYTRYTSRYTRNQSRNHDRKPAPVENDKVKSSGRLLLALDLFLLSSLPSLKNRPLAIFSAASLNRGTKESEM